MGGEQAAKTMLQIQVATLKNKGEVITSEVEQDLLSKLIARYEAQTTPFYAGARLWIDAIIDPAETRKMISEGIAAADHNPDIAEFKTGVFQV
jgi:acetyl-CoA carboxylase carboxyltransferase component